MHLVMGVGGNVGSQVAQNLLIAGEPIRALLHSDTEAARWHRAGAQTFVMDVRSPEKMHSAFAGSHSLFLLNPPASPGTNTVAEETANWRSILAALKSSAITSVVAESTYGAQPGRAIGDLGVLYEMETDLARLPISVRVIRAAYYMSNWDALIATASRTGQLMTLYPADFRLPMVSPQDIGRLAATLLTRERSSEFELHAIEGPKRYSPQDVAIALTSILGRAVEVKSIPRVEWRSALLSQGFSTSAARSMIAMTEIALSGQYDLPGNRVFGQTSLHDHLASAARLSLAPAREEGAA